MIISLDGPDNIGKTTQIDWLTRFGDDNFCKVGPIHHFDEGWNKINPSNYSDWWFKTSSTEDHTNLVLASAQKRISCINKNKVNFVDRSFTMFKNVCIATSTFKDEITLDEAEENINKIIQTNYKPIFEDVRILLLYNEDVEDSVNSLTDREEGIVNERYVRYQKLLYSLLLKERQNDFYHLTITTEGKSILDVQNEIRQFLSAQIPELPFAPLFKNIKQIWGIGGLSESGKSIAGEYLKIKHGFERKKISYFLYNAQHLKGINDIYSNDEKSISHEFIEQLAIFCLYHQEAENISIESLHRLNFTIELKSFFGRRFKILFLKSPLSLRAKRNNTSIDEILKKDEIKIQRGANKIEDIADFVFDNSKTKLSLLLFIDNCYFNFYLKKVNQIVDVEALNFANSSLKKEIKNFIKSIDDNQVKLICITGSGGIGTWKDNWSDIDILVVAENSTLKTWSRLFDIFSNYQYKIGITIYNEKEFYSSFTKPSTNRIKRLLSIGILSPIYVSDNFNLLTIPNNKYNVNEANDFCTILPTLRRLLICEPSNFRQIFKHIILLMKLMLRLNGIEVEGDENILKEFKKEFNEAIGLPPMEQLSEEMNSLNVAAIKILNFLEN